MHVGQYIDIQSINCKCNIDVHLIYYEHIYIYFNYLSSIYLINKQFPLLSIFVTYVPVMIIFSLPSSNESELLCERETAV